MIKTSNTAELAETYPSYHVDIRVRRPDVGVFVTFWTLDQICSTGGATSRNGDLHQDAHTGEGV